jgi:hypothetical protein
MPNEDVLLLADAAACADLPSAKRAWVRRVRVAIFIEHDIIYRHFVQSGAFGKLSKKADVTFVFAAPSSENKRLTATLDPAEIGAQVELLPVEPRRVYAAVASPHPARSGRSGHSRSATSSGRAHVGMFAFSRGGSHLFESQFHLARCCFCFGEGNLDFRSDINWRTFLLPRHVAH